MFTYSILYASQIDSLLNELEKHRGVDSLRLKTWVNLAVVYSNEPETSLQYADSAIPLAKKLNDQKRLAKAYVFSGDAYSNMGNDSVAIAYFNGAIVIYQAINNKEGLGRAYQHISISYYNQAKFRIAIRFLDKSLKAIMEIPDTLKAGSIYNSYGTSYMQLGDYPMAIENFIKAEKIFEKYDPSLLGFPLSNMGLIYISMGKPLLALDYYRKALPYYQKSKNKTGEADTYMHIGSAYDNMDSLDSAMNYYKKSLAIGTEANYLSGIASNLTNMAITYNTSGNHVNALACLEKSIAYYEQIQDHAKISVAYNLMAKIFREADNNLIKKIKSVSGNRYKEALRYNEKALESARTAENLEDVFFTYEDMSKSYEQLNDFKNALLYHKKYIATRDSVVNDENTENITQQKLYYDFDKKEELIKAANDKKHALATAEIKRQTVIKNSVMSGAGILLLSASLSFVFYKRRRDAEKQKIESDLKAEISDVEMKALRSQMNPHFIFNSLNSISEFVLKNDTRTADNYLSKFAKLMRMTLENSEQQEVSLSSDLKVLELYMQLEALRMNNKFSYEISIDESIDADNTLIPPMILQPFVENSIWHGIAKKEGVGKIKISIRKEEDMINCTVEDDGVGRKNQTVKTNSKSLGMKITSERINLINKLKKSKAAIQLVDLAEGFKVEVKLPLELSF